MRQPLTYSLLLHLVVFAAAYFGIPVPDRDMLSVETPVTVDIVTVAEKTNAPAATEKPKPAAKSMPEPAAEPIPPPQPPPKPEARPPEPAPQSEVAKLVPPKPKPTPMTRPKKAEKSPPKPEPKPKPAKTEPEPQQEQVPPTAFESVLKTVEQLKAQPPKTAEKPEKEKSEAALESQVAKALGKSSVPYDEGLPVTMSEIDAVRRQIERCWNLPAGAKDAENLVVSIRVEMNIDGTPRTALVTDQGRMRDDPFYRAAAESAVRAVLNPRCHPFTLPHEKFERWKTMTLVFNPKEMFGT